MHIRNCEPEINVFNLLCRPQKRRNEHKKAQTLQGEESGEGDETQVALKKVKTRGKETQIEA